MLCVDLLVSISPINEDERSKRSGSHLFDIDIPSDLFPRAEILLKHSTMHNNEFQYICFEAWRS